MDDVLAILVKALAGGLLVVLFALLCEAVEPKRFAGLFGAAPAVALAGLSVTLLSKGVPDAKDAAKGMIAGAAGMVSYAAAATVLLKDGPAVRAALLAFPAWLVLVAVMLVAVA